MQEIYTVQASIGGILLLPFTKRDDVQDFISDFAHSVLINFGRELEFFILYDKY